MSVPAVFDSVRMATTEQAVLRNYRKLADSEKSWWRFACLQNIRDERLVQLRARKAWKNKEKS